MTTTATAAATATATPAPVAIVFDVGGVFRDGSAANTSCAREAFAAHATALDPGWCARTFYSARGLTAFNALEPALRLLHATAGVPLDDNEHVRMTPALLDALVDADADADADDDDDAKPAADRDTTAITSERALKATVARRCAQLGGDDALYASLADDYRRRFAEPARRDDIVLFDGVDAALGRLRSLGYRLGVLSNSTDAALRRDIGHLYAHFDFVIADARKPATEVFERTLRDADVDATRTVYVGDAASDVLLGRRARSATVAVLSGMGTERQLRAARPCYVFESFVAFAADVLPRDEATMRRFCRSRRADDAAE